MPRNSTPTAAPGRGFHLQLSSRDVGFPDEVLAHAPASIEPVIAAWQTARDALAEATAAEHSAGEHLWSLARHGDHGLIPRPGVLERDLDDARVAAETASAAAKQAQRAERTAHQRASRLLAEAANAGEMSRLLDDADEATQRVSELHAALAEAFTRRAALDRLTSRQRVNRPDGVVYDTKYLLGVIGRRANAPLTDAVTAAEATLAGTVATPRELRALAQRLGVAPKVTRA
ncbi:hypothetical protein [Microbacterium sp. LWS13-1.2]|uniref:DUF222 domain-containing protein n=1 Tax=Microbacterium sp. LWS13-1.2 TaxID=3135264 RepID=A0AAU6SGA2_9MICO